MIHQANNFKNYSYISIKLLCLFPSLIAGLIGGLIYFKHSQNILGSLICFGMVFFTTGFGFTINNLVDRYKDRYAPKVRSKLILVDNPRALKIAIFNSILFFLFSFLLSLNLNLQALIINTTALLILTLYSYINNKYGIVANFLTALCPALLVWIYPVQQDLMIDSLLLFSYIFIYIFSREIIMDTNDRFADAKIGKSSFPILFGEKFSKIFAFALLIATSIILTFIITYNGFNSFLLFPIIGSTIVSAIGYLAYIKSSTEQNFKYFFNSTSFSYLLILIALV
jgi:4-hydroxybenzoate polyprenyltransferase